MMEVKEWIQPRLEVLSVAMLEGDVFALAYKYETVQFFTLNSQSYTTLHIELLSHKTTALSFHPNKPLLAIAHDTVMYIIDTNSGLTLQTIRTYDETIQTLYFIKDSPYLVAGTRRGRADLYRSDAFSKLSRLCSFPLKREKVLLKNNYISSFAYHNPTLACAGHGGGISFINPYSLTNKHSFIDSTFHISVLKFLKYNRIISGNIHGELHIYNTLQNKAPKTINTAFDSIEFIVLLEDERYALVASNKTSKIALIDIKDEKTIKTNYLQFKQDIKFINYFQNLLLITLQNNTIVQINLKNTQELQQMLVKSDLAAAYNLIEENPLLQSSKEFQELETLYKKLYLNAIEGLIHSNDRNLKKMKKIFKDSKSKMDELKELEIAFSNYARLKTLYRDKKFPLALVLTDKYPLLQNTPIYFKIEEKFKADFSFAQKQILLKNTSLAQELLSPYMIVASKKELLSLLLRDNTDFIHYLKAISKKDYKSVCELVEKNKVFKNIGDFHSIENEIHDTIANIYKNIDGMEVKKAKQLIKKIHNIPQLKNQLKELYFTIQELERLLHYYDKDDFKTCYEIIDNNPLLQNTHLAKLLESHWKKLINKCEISALMGDIKSVKKTLDELLFINTRRAKIGDLLRLSFYTKIKQLLAKKQYKKAENLLYSFIDIFGIDDDLQHLILRYEKLSKTKLAITIGENLHKARDEWVKSDILD